MIADLGPVLEALQDIDRRGHADAEEWAGVLAELLSIAQSQMVPSVRITTHGNDLLVMTATDVHEDTVRVYPDGDTWETNR